MWSSPNAVKPSCPTKPLAFTLIELLVVVAIIGLLLSILLPSLSRAREKARSSVCLSHLNQVATARSLYSLEFNGWLAGPYTSGALHTYGPSQHGIEGADISTGTTPVQNLDWASPTLGMVMTLRAKDISRMVQLLNTELACPSNKEFYDHAVDEDLAPVHEVAGVKVSSIRYASYVAAEGFHLIGEDHKRQFSDPSHPGWGRDVTAEKADIGPSVVLDFPENYYPMEERIGTPSNKVYVLEGARYIDAGGFVTFNHFRYQDEGGNFMAFGPGIGKDPDPTHLDRNGVELPEELNEVNAKYAWRHEGGMNLAFFDGHCEHRKWKETLGIQMYFPSGTIITRDFRTQDPNDYMGMEIP